MHSLNMHMPKYVRFVCVAMFVVMVPQVLMAGITPSGTIVAGNDSQNNPSSGNTGVGIVVGSAVYMVQNRDKVIEDAKKVASESKEKAKSAWDAVKGAWKRTVSTVKEWFDDDEAQERAQANARKAEARSQAATNRLQRLERYHQIKTATASDAQKTLDVTKATGEYAARWSSEIPPLVDTTQPGLAEQAAAALANSPMRYDGLTPRAFTTPPSNPQWGKLNEAEQYRQAAADYVASPNLSYRQERSSLLTMADVGLNAADQSAALGHTEASDGYLQAANSLLDMVFSYENMVGVVSYGSSFVAGVLEGALGLPSDPLVGYEKPHALGKITGSSVALVGDAATIAAGITTAAGGGGLAVGSAGVLVPVGAAAAVEGSALASAGIGNAVWHTGKFQEGLNEWNQAQMAGETRSGRSLSPNQMNKAIQTGRAPNGIVRVDTPRVSGEQIHVHFDNDAALNFDGTWKHGSHVLTSAQRDWLISNGWKVP